MSISATFRSSDYLPHHELYLGRAYYVHHYDDIYAARITSMSIDRENVCIEIIKCMNKNTAYGEGDTLIVHDLNIKAVAPF